MGNLYVDDDVTYYVDDDVTYFPYQSLFVYAQPLAAGH